MSFGWSAGDLASAVKLINSIVTSLRSTSGAREQFQELETELFGLEHALEHIDSLSRAASPYSSSPEIQTLKFVSLYCVKTLERFHDKIKPFEDSLGAQSNMTKLRAAPRMVRWELLLKKDLPELRQYLMAHVGYLNLELSTASLKLVSRANQHLDEIQLQNERTVELIVQRMGNYSKTDKNVEYVRETVNRIWSSNNELANMLRTLSEKTTTPPDTVYTWVQQPIRFENALGNVMPVASESDWDILEAIILAQFSKGPGRKKVFAGEYELFESSTDLVIPINATTYPHLRPGARITMAIIIGQYSGSQRCPRLGCSSNLISDAGMKGYTGRLCSSCGTWVRRSDKILPKPLRPPTMGNVALQPPAAGHISVGPSEFSSPTYPERLAYKNISIYVTELPPTPPKVRHHLVTKPRPQRPPHSYAGPPPAQSAFYPHSYYPSPPAPLAYYPYSYQPPAPVLRSEYDSSPSAEGIYHPRRSAQSAYGPFSSSRSAYIPHRSAQSAYGYSSPAAQIVYYPSPPSSVQSAYGYSSPLPVENIYYPYPRPSHPDGKPRINIYGDAYKRNVESEPPSEELYTSVEVNTRRRKLYHDYNRQDSIRTRRIHGDIEEDLYIRMPLPPRPPSGRESARRLREDKIEERTSRRQPPVSIQDTNT